MSGIVPATGLLRKLYEEAKGHDIEYKSSAFWQAMLQVYFKVEDNYVPVCEYSPDEGRSRTDNTVLKYDANHHTLAIMTVVEAKRRGASIKDAEKDALRSSLRVIDKYNMVAIYAMATWETSFRIWYVDKRERRLQPLDGGEDKQNYKPGYIDADSAEAVCFLEAVQFIKNEPPLREAPVLPSQAGVVVSNYASLYGEQLQALGASMSAADTATSIEWQPMVTDAVDDHEGYAAEPVVASQQQVAESVSRKSERVTVVRKRHTLAPDEFIFTRNRREQRTKKEEWVWDEEYKVWNWTRSKNTLYYTETLN